MPDNKTVTPLTKDEWIKRASEKLERLIPGWDPAALAEYVDVLYEGFVTDSTGYESDPEGAVVEDLSNWD
ncbi:hypothetical protein [Pandoraea commovens]|uniref:Uncharacterized protein n=1 Tax=Pandoraea commovens TaxID=2508289 RepID=A0A5E4XC87_9BURK|nr:hypothetical protein [Pandoraea commovens]VVE33906.1 hypothetical protein PCO31010_03814 [Pandoraea commovens]